MVLFDSWNAIFGQGGVQYKNTEITYHNYIQSRTFSNCSLFIYGQFIGIVIAQLNANIVQLNRLIWWIIIVIETLSWFCSLLQFRIYISYISEFREVYRWELLFHLLNKTRKNIHYRNIVWRSTSLFILMYSETEHSNNKNKQMHR